MFYDFNLFVPFGLMNDLGITNLSLKGIMITISTMDTFFTPVVSLGNSTVPLHQNMEITLTLSCMM